MRRHVKWIGAGALFPCRFVGIPALALELLCQRIDRTVVIGLLAFLIHAGGVSQIELCTAASSAVVMEGLPTQSIRRSDAPGLSDETRASTSMVSVSSSAG